MYNYVEKSRSSFNLNGKEAIVSLDKNNYIAIQKTSVDGPLVANSVYIDNLGTITSGKPYIIENDYNDGNITIVGEWIEKINERKAVLSYSILDITTSYSSGIAICLEKDGNEIFSSGKIFVDKTPYWPSQIDYYSSIYPKMLNETNGIFIYNSSGVDNCIKSKTFSIEGSGISLYNNQIIEEESFEGYVASNPMVLSSNNILLHSIDSIGVGTSYLRFISVNNNVASTGNHLNFSNYGICNTIVQNSGSAGMISTSNSNVYRKLSIDYDNESVDISSYTIQSSGNGTYSNLECKEINSNYALMSFTTGSDIYELNKYDIISTSGIFIVSSGTFYSTSNPLISTKDIGNIVIVRSSPGISMFSDIDQSLNPMSIFSYGTSTITEQKYGTNFSSIITYAKFNPIYGGQYNDQPTYDRVYGDVENDSGIYTIKFFADENRLYEIARYSSVSASGTLININGSGIGDGLDLTFSYEVN